MAAEVSVPVRLVCEPVPRAPCVTGLSTVGVGGDVAHLLEGVAAVAEALRPVREGLQFPCLHLRCRPARVSRSRISGVMRSTARSSLCDLTVQHVDEAPHQRLALVGHLRAVDGDAAPR